MDKPLTEYQRGMLDASRVCEEQISTFRDQGYAGESPLASFAERFACALCAGAIREAANLPPEVT